MHGLSRGPTVVCVGALYLLSAGCDTAPASGSLLASTFACPPSVRYCDLAVPVGVGSVRSFGRGAAAPDLDVDGFPDLFLVDTDFPATDPVGWGRSAAYLNRAGTGFERVDLGISDEALAALWVASFGDYDNDGDPDVILGAGGYTAPARLSFYENRMPTEGRFVDATTRLLAAPRALVGRTFWGATWGDYDADGLLDVLVSPRDGGPILFHNRGDGTLEDVALAVGVDAPNAYDAKNPVFFDFDRDGDLDLYIGGIDLDGFFRNDGGTFTALPSPFEGLPEGPFAFATAAADFDQDGYDDLYVGRWSCQDYVLFGGPDGSLTRLGPEVGLDQNLQCEAISVPLVPFENTMGLAIVDLYDDGWPDVYIGTGDPENAAADVMFCNRGNRRFERCSEDFVRLDDPHLATRGHGLAQLDFDRDGDGDLVMNPGGHPATIDHHDGREVRRFFVRDGSAGRASLVVRLVGTRSNRDAVGARFVLHADREIHGAVRSTQGFQSQNAAAIVLPTSGIGQLQLDVTWPTGRTTRHTVTAGRENVVLEPF